MTQLISGKTSAAAQSRSNTAADSLQKVVATMVKLQVLGLPRNYELFYEALYGHNADLTRDVLSLNGQPAQVVLDQIGLKHRLVGHCGAAEQSLQGDATDLLNDLLQQLSAGIDRKQAFSRALEKTIRGARDDENRGLSEVMDDLDFLAAAAGDIVRSETALSQALQAGLTQMEATRKAAKAARQASLRDRLTHLPNRQAFSSRVTSLYSGDTNPAETTLIVVEIDHFKSLVDRYGEAATGRILKRLATIFRKSIKKNDFVARTGIDEFSFLFDGVSSEAARSIAERLHSSVVDNLVFATEDGNTTGNLGLMMGYAMAQDAVSATQLVGQAETALAAARHDRRSPIVGYTPAVARTVGRNAA